MKLRQNGIVSFLIRLAAIQARGVARVKLHQVKSEPQNIEYRMSNGGFASLSHYYKIDRIHYFNIRYSLFDIRYSLFQSFFFDQTGRFSGQRRRSYETSYEIPSGRNIDQIERRTSNAQHRTLNIDDATLYRFYNKRTAESRRVDLLPVFVATSAE